MSDLLSVTVRGELMGRAISCGFNYHKSTGPLDVARTGMMNTSWAGHFLTAWLAALSHDYTLQMIECRDPERETAAPNFIPYQQNQGSIAEQSLPSSQAAIIRLAVDADTSRNNGRLYIAGIPETALLEQRLTDAYRTGVLTTLADLMLDDLVLSDGSTWQMVVLIRDRVNHPPNVPDWNPVVQATPLAKLITQRLRKTNLLGTEAT